MSDIESFIKPTIDSPSDDAPKIVFKGWLEENTDYPNYHVQEYLNWTWYWDTLIPTMRDTFNINSFPYDIPSHSQSVGTYYPRRTLRNMKAALVPYWACAVVRTFRDQGGNTLWGHLSHHYKKYIALHESLLVRVNYTYKEFYTYTGDEISGNGNKKILRIIKTVGNRSEEDLERYVCSQPWGAHTRINLHRTADCLWPNMVAYCLPVNGDADSFFSFLLEFLVAWERKQALADQDDRQKQIYDTRFLMPTWLMLTMEKASKLWKQHLDQLSEAATP